MGAYWERIEQISGRGRSDAAEATAHRQAHLRAAALWSLLIRTRHDIQNCTQSVSALLRMMFPLRFRGSISGTWACRWLFATIAGFLAQMRRYQRPIVPKQTGIFQLALKQCVRVLETHRNRYLGFRDNPVDIKQDDSHRRFG